MDLSPRHTLLTPGSPPHCLPPWNSSVVLFKFYTCVTNCPNFSSLKPQPFVILKYVRSDVWVCLAGFSTQRFTREKSKCQLGWDRIWKMKGRTDFGPSRPLAVLSFLCMWVQSSSLLPGCWLESFSASRDYLVLGRWCLLIALHLQSQHHHIGSDFCFKPL